MHAGGDSCGVALVSGLEASKRGMEIKGDGRRRREAVGDGGRWWEMAEDGQRRREMLGEAKRWQETPGSGCGLQALSGWGWVTVAVERG